MSSPPSPVALTLRRRERDERRRQQAQYALGRPRPSHRLCGNDECVLRCCSVYETSLAHLPVYLLGDNDRSRDGIPVQDIWTDFAYLATTRTWPSIDKQQSDALLRAQSVEAFAASPPVRAAYLGFRSLCDKHDLGFAIESRLRDALSTAASEFGGLLTTLDSDGIDSDSDHAERTIHRFLQARRPDQTHLPLTQQACIVRFLLTTELWRRHDERHMRRRGWAWGDESWIVVAELLCAVLLQYWLMDREGCFERVPCRGGEQCDEAWQQWLDKYPLLDEDTGTQLVPKPMGLIKGLDPATELGYVGGVGTAARGPLWTDRRHGEGDDILPKH